VEEAWEIQKKECSALSHVVGEFDTKIFSQCHVLESFNYL
jgi:hypothetical protein